MSFIGDLFGGNSQAQVQAPVAPPPLPTPTPTPTLAVPTIDDASVLSAGSEAANRLNKRYGQAQTLLTSGLGDSSSGGDSDVSRTTALGGNTALTPGT